MWSLKLIAVLINLKQGKNTSKSNKNLLWLSNLLELRFCYYFIYLYFQNASEISFCFHSPTETIHNSLMEKKNKNIFILTFHFIFKNFIKVHTNLVHGECNYILFFIFYINTTRIKMT